MGLTILEAAKTMEDPLQRAIVMTFAASSPILQVLPFENIQGSAIRYNVEHALPGVGFRGINEAWTSDVGVVNPQFDPLVIAGGDLDVDRFITTTEGMDRRATETLGKAKALGLKYTQVFIKGDTGSNPRQFDGLQTRLVIGGDQVLDAGNTAGGAAVSLFKLNELRERVEDGDMFYFVMNERMWLRLSAAARTQSLSGILTRERDEFGRTVAFYDGTPILVLKRDNLDNEILPFTEAAGSGDPTATSIYCCGVGDGAVHGIQSGPPDVRDLGELDTQPVMRTRVEWYTGLALRTARSAARLRFCGDLAMVA